MATITLNDFTKISAKNFINESLLNRNCTDFKKIDLRRSRQINAEILKLFDEFINSQNGIQKSLLWYKSQGWLLYLYKNEMNLLKFYGCNKHIDHHNSNIEWVIKPLLQRMLQDNGSRKILFDRSGLSLVGFGFIPLFKTEVNGNIYQGFDGKPRLNIDAFQVNLNVDQTTLARNILRLIK